MFNGRLAVACFLGSLRVAVASTVAAQDAAAPGERGSSSESGPRPLDANDGGVPATGVSESVDAGTADVRPSPLSDRSSDAGVSPRTTGSDGPGAEAAEAAVPAEVQVQGVRSGSAEDGYRSRRGTLGAFGELSLKDIPFSVSVTPSALWENRNAHTEQEILATNPTVANLMAPLAPGGGGMSRTMVRGGTMGDQGVLRDGIVDRGFTFPWFENVERVEVMGGLTSLLNGFGTLGGTVNYVSKRPKPAPFGVVSVGNYEGGINYVTGDVGGRVPLVDSPRLLFRSVVHKEAGSTFVDGSTERRTLLTTIVTHKPSEDAELSADVAFQQFYAQGLQNYLDVSPAKGIFVPPASIVDPRKQLGQAWTFSESQKVLVGGAAKARLSDAMSVRAAYRYGTMWRNYNTTFGTFTDNAGDYSETYITTPRQSERTRSAYALADFHVATAEVAHHVTTGYSGTEFYYERGNDVKTSLGSSNVAAPLVVQSAPNWTSGSANASRTNYDSFILGDRAVYRWVSVLAGVSYAQIRSKSWTLTGVCTTSGQCPSTGVSDATQGAFTPSVGVVLQPAEPISVYGSYIEGLSQGGSAPQNAANAYEQMSPSHSTQLEIGAKGSLGRLALTAAFFRINQINEYLDPADNDYKQDGRQVNQGLEFTAAGPLGFGLTVVGGLTLLRAETTKAANNPTLEGKVPVNVPQQTGRLYVEYALPFTRGLSIDAGANYNGKRYVDTSNTDSIDASITVDAGARYDLRLYEHVIGASLFVQNIADERYWAYYRSGSGLLAGAPRTVSVSLKAGLW